MNQNLYKNEKGRTAFHIFNWIFLSLAMAITIIPLINTLSISFSSDLASSTPGVMLWPKQFSIHGYKVLFEQVRILTPLINNSIVTLGEPSSMFFSACSPDMLCPVAPFRGRNCLFHL